MSNNVSGTVKAKLVQFSMVTSLSKWDAIDENAELEALRIYREIDSYLYPQEATALTDAWSNKRREVQGSTEKMTKVINDIITRYISA